MVWLTRSTSYALPALLCTCLLVNGCVGPPGLTARSESAPESGNERINPGTFDELPSSERAYVESALALLRENYYAADRVDWSKLERIALERLANVPTRVGSYIAINAVLEHIADGHNRFLSPALEQDNAIRVGALPEVELSTDRLISIALPSVSTNHDTHDAYAMHAYAMIRKLYSDRVCGWIVDLRGNSGGSMYPPLAAVAPLLTGQQVMSLVDRDGTVIKHIAFDTKARMLINGSPAEKALLEQDDAEATVTAETLAILRDPPLVGEDQPVAVLTDVQTASAGEALVVAFEGRSDTRRFGDATRGVPTGPRRFRLDDGAVLIVATTRMSDRTGVVYESAIQPNVESPDPAESAALWLLETESCEHAS
ncbi:S41 family peptidase [soil metagenome]